jgi:hypothetical protein
MGAGREIFLMEAVDERLRDGEAFALHDLRLAVLTHGFDEQVHVWVLPVEPCDRPFDQHLFRRVEHGLAVVGERRRTNEGGDGERPGCDGQTNHDGISERYA